MAIQMRRGNKANLDKTKLVAGEIAVSLDTKEVSVSDGNGDTIDLATKDDLQNIIKLNGGVTIDENTLVISPEEETTEEQGTPVDIESISIDGGMTDNPIKDATARADISSVGGRVTTLEGKIGANNGIATLNGTGKVPESQLPSYVDDVIEGYLYNGAFYEDSAHTTLITGESGKIYVDLSTDKTYRWSGTVYVCTGSSLELGETQGTAYEGSKGKANADNIADIQSVIPANASTSNKLATMEDVGGEAVWGGITGTLSDQTDLKAALDKKCGVDDLLYQFDESAEIPFYMVSEPKTRKVTFTDFRKKITSSFYDFVRKTVGFTTKNIADTSKAEIGVNGAGTANSKCARLIVPCEGSTSYRVTSSGTNNFTQIDYMTTDTLPPSGGYSGISFPTTITTHASDKYIVFVFKKSTDVTQSDVDALKMMVRESSVTDDTYEPYHASVDVAKANRQEIKDTVGWIGKNLDNPFKIDKNTSTDYTKTDKGYSVFTSASVAYGKVFLWYSDLPKNTDLTLTVNADYTSGTGKVVVDGTNDTLANRTFIKGTNTFTADTDVELTFNTGSYKYILVTLQVTDTTSASGNILYDEYMLRKASVIDPTYEPYHPSVEQTLRDAEVIEGKNKLEVTANTQTINGVTFTINRDADGNVESVKANGTASANTDLTLFEGIIKSGTYILSKGYNSSAQQHLGLKIDGYRNGSYVKTIAGSWSTDDTAAVIDYDGYDIVRVKLSCSSGDVLSNLMAYPMLRDPSENNTFEPYYIPLKDSKFDRAEQNVLGAKNWISLNKPIGGNELATITNNKRTVEVKNTTAGTWLQFIFEEKVEKYTDYVISADVDWKSGKGRIAIADVNNASIGANDYTPDITSDGKKTLKFNTGNNSVIRIKLACTLADSEVGDVVYDNLMMTLASDPDSTYAPYAMTNREITEALTVQENAVTNIVSGAVVDSDIGNHVSKYGKVVCLDLSISNVTATANDTILFRIPEGYRPLYPVTEISLNYDNEKFVEAYVLKDTGNVKIRGNVSQKRLRIHQIWITS